MKITVFTSSDPSVDGLIGAARGRIGPAPDFMACYFSEAHGADAVARAAAALSPKAFHAGTSCRGVLAPRALGNGARPTFGCLAIHDGDGDYGTGAAARNGDPRRAAREALSAALAAAGREGESPDLVWLTATPGDEEEIIAGLQDVAGTATPVVGGSAADDAIAGHWRVAAGTGPALADGLVVSALFPSEPLSLAFQNGYAPTEHSGTVTKVDGRRLLSIDGEPAAAVYARWAGAPDWLAGDGTRSILAEATFAPLGRPITTVSNVPFYLLSHPAAAHPDGGIDLFSTVDEGETVCLMEGSPESLAARAARVTRQALAGRASADPPAGALLVYCGGCMLAVEDRIDQISDEVAEALGGAPFLGIFTFGEQGLVTGGANRHGNLMVSCIVFGD